jgi:hypothetical protein
VLLDVAAQSGVSRLRIGKLRHGSWWCGVVSDLDCLQHAAPSYIRRTTRVSPSKQCNIVSHRDWRRQAAGCKPRSLQDRYCKRVANTFCDIPSALLCFTTVSIKTTPVNYLILTFYTLTCKCRHRKKESISALLSQMFRFHR